MAIGKTYYDFILLVHLELCRGFITRNISLFYNFPNYTPCNKHMSRQYVNLVYLLHKHGETIQSHIERYQ